MPISIIRTSGESSENFIGANWGEEADADSTPVLGSIHIFVIFVFHLDANYALFTHTHTQIQMQ